MTTRTESTVAVAFENPTGAAVASWVVSYTASVSAANTVVHTVAAPAIGATFTDSAVLNPDTYTITIQAFDGATPPNAVGPLQTDPASPLTITAVTQVSVAVPGAVTGTTTQP